MMIDNEIIQTELFDPIIPYLHGTQPGKKFVIFHLPHAFHLIDKDVVLKYFETDATMGFTAGQSYFTLQGTIKEQSVFDYIESKLFKHDITFKAND